SDGIWHFAGNTQLHGGRDDGRDAWRTNDIGTAALLNLLRASDRPGPLLHVSTAYVCGTMTGVVDEDDASPRSFRNDYEASKFSAERRVREAFAAGLRGCIFRPGVV